MKNNIKLGDIIDTQKGYAFKSKWYQKSGRPIVKVTNFTDNSVSKNNMDFISEDIATKYERYNLKSNDVIIQTVGSWPSNPDSVVGKVIKIPYFLDGALLNQNAVKVIPKNITTKTFLFYLLKDNNFKKYIIGTAQGAASQASITLDAIRNYSFILPNTVKQQKIVSVLSTYDKLIENNTRRIEILEEMAQRIYKEWFVDFKYLGHDNDKLVDSELGMIPEKWKINNLDKYVSFDRGTEPGSKNYQDNKSENTIPFLRVGDLSARNKHVYISKELAKEKILEKKDIVITLDGTVGIVKTGLEGCFSTGLRKCRIINDLINREFLFYTLKSRNIQSTIKAHATGSTILHASSSIKYMKFALPSNKIMNNFFEMINPIISEKQILNDKNYNLSKTRDYLLPKLISGKVDVSDLDIDTCILDE